jgi:hypothetical protein
MDPIFANKLFARACQRHILPSMIAQGSLGTVQHAAFLPIETGLSPKHALNITFVWYASDLKIYLKDSSNLNCTRDA